MLSRPRNLPVGSKSEIWKKVFLTGSTAPAWFLRFLATVFASLSSRSAGAGVIVISKGQSARRSSTVWRARFPGLELMAIVATAARAALVSRSEF